MPVLDLATARARSYDICVVGSGAAGMALALSSHGRGLRVLMVEQGSMSPGEANEMPCGVLSRDAAHDPLDQVSCRALGGTLHWWGGRAVPLDPEDFEPLQAGGAAPWPLSYDEYTAWVPQAAEFLGVSDVFSDPLGPPWTALDAPNSDHVERLTKGPKLVSALAQRVLAPDGPDVLLQTAATGLNIAGIEPDATVTGLEVLSAGETTTLQARHFALCAGGLEVARLLLADHRRRGGTDPGMLGRGYMGHLTGSIGTIRLSDPEAIRHFGYTSQGGKRPARRRLMPRIAGQPNIAFWIENLAMDDPAHGSGIQSLKFLALRSRAVGGAFLSAPLRWKLAGEKPLRFWAHLRNIATEPATTAWRALRLLRRRLRSDDRPADLLVPNRSGHYRLAYHAEQLPDPANRVVLTDRTDALGRPLLQIDLRYGPADIEAVLEAHLALAESLSTAGLAEISLVGRREDLLQMIDRQARDGYHQMGLTRMAERPSEGVVDRNCRVFGMRNLFVASASIFPRSGQANPTLSIVAFALRLADHLAREGR
ncbi:MAG: GMC family oxidoreductase [Pseudomonadota bacterium]